MHVYLVRTIGVYPSAVKVGKARNVKKRVGNLQVGCPYTLELLGYVSCKDEEQAYEIEAELQEIFKRDAIRGEWFLYSSRIENMCQSVVGRWQREDGKPIYIAQESAKEREETLSPYDPVLPSSLMRSNFFVEPSTKWLPTKSKRAARPLLALPSDEQPGPSVAQPSG